MLVVDVWLAFLLSASTLISTFNHLVLSFPGKGYVVPSTRAPVRMARVPRRVASKEALGCCHRIKMDRRGRRAEAAMSANDLQLQVDAYCTHTVYIVSFKHAFWCILQLFLRKNKDFHKKMWSQSPQICLVHQETLRTQARAWGRRPMGLRWPRWRGFGCRCIP